MQGSMTWKACKTQLKMKYYLAAVFIKENRTCAVLLQLGLGSFPVAVTTLKPVFSNRRYKEYQGRYFTYFQSLLREYLGKYLTYFQIIAIIIITGNVSNLRWQDRGHWGLGRQPEAGLEPSCWDMIVSRSGAPLESSYSAGCPYTRHCRLPREETTISADLTWHAIWRWVQHWFLFSNLHLDLIYLILIWKIW